MNETVVPTLLAVSSTCDGSAVAASVVLVDYTNGTDFRPAKRLPVEHIVHFDTW